MADSAQLPLPTLSAPQPGARGDALGDKLCALLERRGRPLEVGHVVSQLLRLRACPERLGRVLVGEIVDGDSRLAWHGRDLVGLAPDGWASRPFSEASFCVIDLETTGGSPGRSRVTEIAAVRVRGLRLGEALETLVDPGQAIPAGITGITGITDAMVAGQPDIAEALPRLLEFCGDDVLVAHNAPFDLRFLNYERRRLLGTYFTQPWLDTLSLARRLVTGVDRFDLATLADWAGTEVRPCHRALPDAQAAAGLLVALLGILADRGETTLERAVALGQSGGSRNSHKLALTEGLPQSPGVYIMRDRRGNVVYVGKALNLRRRVRSYFGPNGRHGRRVGRALDALERVDHEVCGSEFEAVWREARLLNEHRPPGNRRGMGGGHFLKLTVGEEYPRLYAVAKAGEAGAVHAGPVRSLRAARAAIDAIHLLYPLRTCRWPCPPGRPADAGRPCSGPCSADPAAYARVAEEVRELLTGDVVAAARSLQRRLAESAAQGRVRHGDADAVQALLTVLSGIARVRRAAAARAVLVEAAALPGHAVAFFVAGGRVVRREVLAPSGAAARAAAAAGIRAMRAVPDGLAVPPDALPEMWIVADRLAARRRLPAHVAVAPGAGDGDVHDAVRRAVQWVVAAESPAVTAESEDVTTAA